MFKFLLRLFSKGSKPVIKIQHFGSVDVKTEIPKLISFKDDYYVNSASCQKVWVDRLDENEQSTHH